MTGLELSLRTVLVVVFGMAAISKLSARRALADFAGSLGDIAWLRNRWRWVAAAAVPVAEVTTAALLLIPSTVTWGFAAATVMLTVFSSVAAVEMRRGSGLRCRCFGSSSGQIGPVQLTRNILLIAVSITGLAIAPVGHGGIGAAGLILALAPAMIAGVALVRWDDLSALVRAS
jgi:hypothetical protein